MGEWAKWFKSAVQSSVVCFLFVNFILLKICPEPVIYVVLKGNVNPFSPTWNIHPFMLKMGAAGMGGHVFHNTLWFKFNSSWNSSRASWLFSQRNTKKTEKMSESGDVSWLVHAQWCITSEITMGKCPDWKKRKRKYMQGVPNQSINARK